MPDFYDVTNIPRPRKQSLLSRLKFEKVQPILVDKETLVNDGIFTAAELASDDVNTVSVHSTNAAEGLTTVEDIAFENWLKADGLRRIFQTQAEPNPADAAQPVIWDAVLERSVHKLVSRPGKQYSVGTTLNARLPDGSGRTLQHLVVVFEDSAKNPNALEVDSVIFYNAQTQPSKNEFCPNRSAKKNAEARRLLVALLDNAETLNKDAQAVRANPQVLTLSEEFKYVSPKQQAELEAAKAAAEEAAKAAEQPQPAAEEQPEPASPQTPAPGAPQP
jgi:hypothetical protein